MRVFRNMSKMATLWFSVVVIVLINSVVGVQRDCSFLDRLDSCNECIRCGGYWCTDPTQEHRCQRELLDNWCNNNIAKLKTMTLKDENLTEDDVEGKEFDVKYQLRSLKIGLEDEFDFNYKSKLHNPKVSLDINSTQSTDITIGNKTKCNDNYECTTTINVQPGWNFCAYDGTPEEFFHVKLSVEGLKEEPVLKVHVPCACSCSGNVVEFSPICNGRGSSECGVCDCKEGWKGRTCEKADCPHKDERRGDTPCREDGAFNDCWGNGKCNQCDKCECFPDKEGSRYFDQVNNCADICLSTNDCEDCFSEPLGVCRKYEHSGSGRCNFALTKLRFNETALDQRDSFNRTLWVRCNVTIHEESIEYIVMRDDNDETFFMIPEPVTQGQTGVVSLTVPVVAAVIATLLVGAAVAGYMVWKNRTPPVPFTDPMYQNIDAEDCTGENPLYKPPTSSFKNPTYGKW